MAMQDVKERLVERRLPMNKPDGHIPAIQRYSVRLPEDVERLQMLYLGVQGTDKDHPGFAAFLGELKTLFRSDHGPVHIDFASFVDPEDYVTLFAVAYWRDPDVYRAWRQSPPVTSWWQDPARVDGPLGYFWEAMETSVEQSETIAFKEYVRGLSACPMSRLEPMDESGYWGAARDRMPASAYDELETAHNSELSSHDDRVSLGKRIAIEPPRNFTVIRSGVSWMDCGDEQLRSYETNLRPKLDAGMEHLRTHPIDTGCCSLRQVTVVDADGQPREEAYSVGYFLSLAHLERWAREHPTHLAIYTRALMERKKYQEKLELRTYHEVYVVDGETMFEYINCHNRTGLIPFFDMTNGDTTDRARSD